MQAIPKALAMTNPKHVVACVATAAGVISSKLAIDAVGNKIDDTDMDKVESTKRPWYDLTDEDWSDRRMAEETKCMEAWENC